MYIPDDFRETRTKEIKRIITDFPLACIVASTPEDLLPHISPWYSEMIARL